MFRRILQSGLTKRGFQGSTLNRTTRLCSRPLNVFNAESSQSARQNVRGMSRIYRCSSTVASSAKTQTQNDEPKSTSDYFLDHLGKIFFAAIGAVIATLVRSSLGNNNQTAERELLEVTSALDPLEIDDLRTANGPDFNLQVYQTILKDLELTLAGKEEILYEEFVAAVLATMRRIKGEKFTVQFGHLVDRVVIDLLQRQFDGAINKQQSTKTTGFGSTLSAPNETLPVPLLLAALSLALYGNVQDRVDALFDVMQHFPQSQATTDSFQMPEKKKDVVKEADVVSMVSHLRDTCQLPPGAQILKTDVKYPIQQYRRGAGEELYTRARQDLFGTKEEYTREEFNQILHSAFVCAWGECYGPLKKKKKRSSS